MSIVVAYSPDVYGRAALDHAVGLALSNRIDGKAHAGMPTAAQRQGGLRVVEHPFFRVMERRRLGQAWQLG